MAIGFDDTSVHFDDSSMRFDGNPVVLTGGKSRAYTRADGKVHPTRLLTPGGDFDSALIMFDDSSVPFDGGQQSRLLVARAYTRGSGKVRPQRLFWPTTTLALFDDPTVLFDDPNVRFGSEIPTAGSFVFSMPGVDRGPGFDDPSVHFDDASVPFDGHITHQLSVGRALLGLRSRSASTATAAVRTTGPPLGLRSAVLKTSALKAEPMKRRRDGLLAGRRLVRDD